MKKNVKLAAPLIIIIAIIIAALFFFVYKNGVLKTGAIKVSGNIEATDVRLSFRVAGQVEELLADEGSVLKAGEIVARLNTDELVKIRNREAASLKAAEFQVVQDGTDFVRAENLFNVGAIPAQKRDLAKTKADSSRALVDQLRSSLELANTRLAFAELASPINGYVIVKSAEAGEVVQMGAPIFTAIDLNDVWLTAYINESDLGRVKLNQKAYVKTDTYPFKRYNGRISFISQQAEFTPKQIQTTEERVKLVYRVKIKCDNSNLELKPGMPADGYIIE